MTDDIRQWLETLGLENYSDAFEENRIDADVLPTLTNDDLKDIGIVAVGDRRKLSNAISTLGKQTEATSTERSTAAERRQLTVMFCDLVGSTELSRQLDPEDLRDVMRRYQDAVAGAVTRYGGYVAKYLGDGVLAYFGWPQAFEDQAERAVRAGLHAVEAVSALKATEDSLLSARVGIATGQVVVGDLVGESGLDAEAVSGETPNLAARLQDAAGPGQCAIDDATRQLVAQAYHVEDVGSHDLKGFEDAVQIWKIAGEVVAESRFEAAHGATLTHIIGRDGELQILQDRWQMAKAGSGQIVLISGEPGIGKSRLIEGLSDLVAPEDHIRVHYQCSPYHGNTALYPTIRQFERGAGFTPDDDGEAKLDKLEILLRHAGRDFLAHAPLFAHLLSLPYEKRYGAFEQSPQQIKERLLDVLIAHLQRLSERRPVLFLFEDAHWVDPTSQELLEVAASQLDRTRVLLIVTYRPEWEVSVRPHEHVNFMQLSRLNKTEGAEIVRNIAGNYVPDDVIERIVSRTDGVPLFIEELTKSLVEGGLDIADADIPATLQASLLARIDRLGAEAKEVVQIGAVIGREFSLKLLAPVSGMPDTVIEEAMLKLAKSELIFPTGRSADVNYTFKHALIQDAAYQSLLKSTRQDFHRLVAELMENRFPETIETQPELLARHYGEAGMIEKSISYWYRAGQQAVERSADLEAVAHLSKGRALLIEQPESKERDALELDICLTLGPVLMSTKGLASPEAEVVYLRAMELCPSIGEPALSFQAAWGVWLVYHQRGEIDLAKTAAAEVLSLAEMQSENVDHMLQAHHAAWTTQIFVGNIATCQQHVAAGIELYDIEKHRHHAFYYGGHDPGVCGKTTSAEALCLLGFADQAVQQATDAMTLAEQLSHPFSEAMAHYFVAQVHQYRREADIVGQQAQTTIDMCEKFGFESFRTQGMVLLGWATAMSGEIEPGINLMREGLEAFKATGTGMRRPYFLALLADTLLHAEHINEGLEVIAEAEELIARSGETRWLAETHRLKGALMEGGAATAVQVEKQYQHAMQIARRQEAKWLELRVTVSLGRHWRGQGNIVGARQLLSPLYATFSEGFDTPDLMAAKSLLTELL